MLNFVSEQVFHWRRQTWSPSTKFAFHSQEEQAMYLSIFLLYPEEADMTNFSI